MKKHLSVFGLFVRSSVYKILGILFLTGILETTVFYYNFKSSLSRYEYGEGMKFLEDLAGGGVIPFVFAAAFIAVTVLLCMQGTEYKTKTGYTLRRLRVGEKHIFFYQAFYNMIAYTLLIAWQTAICFGFCKYYAANAPAEIISTQTVFLAFYRSKFLHTLLPISDVLLWIRNGFMVAALSLAAAEFPYKQRRGGFAVSVIAFALYAIAFFNCEIGAFANIILTYMVSALIIYAALAGVLRKGEAYED